MHGKWPRSIAKYSDCSAEQCSEDKRMLTCIPKLKFLSRLWVMSFHVFPFFSLLTGQTSDGCLGCHEHHPSAVKAMKAMA